ncbi:MAG: hypothetical protein E7A28_08490 [Streptococcus salivarius]|nr:hypothetical protein [Streptococcus salivarius]
MGAIWILFIPFIVIFYASSEKKIKGLNRRIKGLEKQLKGQTVSVRLNGFGSNWKIVDFDEDWVKLSRLIKQHRVTKLVRIEDVELIQQLR